MGVVLGWVGVGLAACDGSGPRTMPGDVVTDVSDGVSEDVWSTDVQVADGVVDGVNLDDAGGTKDSGSVDALTDIVGDVVVSDVVDGGSVDSGSDVVECEPVSCALFCEHGFQLDENNCPVCACKDCEVAADCQDVMTCTDPMCTAAGSCRCECLTPVTMPTLACGPIDVSVPYCSCSLSKGVVCDPDAHYLCPNVCKPGEFIEFPCPDGATINPPACDCGPISRKPVCHPVCIADGVLGEGYYDSCTSQLMKNADCANLKTPDGVVQQCPAVCGAIGSKSEGWYMGCGSGGLIAWANCAPKWDCPDDIQGVCGGSDCVVGTAALFSCGPKGEMVPWCECKPKDALHCAPTCAFAGTPSEGWYDPCSGALIQKGSCEGCGVSCDLVGTKSEGWYSSCADGLIVWDNCAAKSGTWTCAVAPWNLCFQ